MFNTLPVAASRWVTMMSSNKDYQQRGLDGQARVKTCRAKIVFVRNTALPGKSFLDLITSSKVFIVINKVLDILDP